MPRSLAFTGSTATIARARQRFKRNVACLLNSVFPHALPGALPSLIQFGNKYMGEYLSGFYRVDAVCIIERPALPTEKLL